MTLTVHDVLGPDGQIARRMPNYEIRPQQLEMAEGVADAIQRGHHLVVEAGTGVGKSFGYLVPAILSSVKQPEGPGSPAEQKRKRIIISTHTISLQEQLIQNDLPFLNAVLPIEFSAVLVKGRSNYISLRRLQAAWERAASMLALGDELNQLRRVREWAKETSDGSLASLEFQPAGSVWDEVKSEHGNCLGRKCPTYEECHYYAARRRAWNADLLVVNHALFFSDLALRREGASILPEYEAVIFDEAHTLEQVAADHMGLTVTNRQIEYQLNKLYNDRQQKGLLMFHAMQPEQQLVQRIRYLSDNFFQNVLAAKKESAGPNGRVRARLKIANPLSDELRTLAIRIRQGADGVADEGQQIELVAAADSLTGHAVALNTWLEQKIDDAVYWIEETGRQQQTIKLISAPIEIGDLLRDELFNQVRTTVLTSATLAVGREDFSFLRQRLGVTKAHELKLGSPFDYRTQMRLVLAEGMPDPGDDPKKYEAAVCERICKHVVATEGRAFVLFTSYQMLRGVANRLQPWFVRQNLNLLCQGESMPRSQMLQKFRREPRSVLFGTESFWQGVDVPGEALQNVIITKLPFSVPDQPLEEARIEKIRERGGNPFMEYQVPEAAIKLKQGFGRLIRTKTDTGQVVILDPRIRTKRYGRLFLETLPECRVVID